MNIKIFKNIYFAWIVFLRMLLKNQFYDFFKFISLYSNKMQKQKWINLTEIIAPTMPLVLLKILISFKMFQQIKNVLNFNAIFVFQEKIGIYKDILKRNRKTVELKFMQIAIYFYL